MGENGQHACLKCFIKNTYDDRCAGDLSKFAEGIVVVVVRRAEIGLASGQPSLHLDIEESILHAKAFLLGCKILNSSLLRLKGWTEKSIAFLVSLN